MSISIDTRSIDRIIIKLSRDASIITNTKTIDICKMIRSMIVRGYTGTEFLSAKMRIIGSMKIGKIMYIDLFDDGMFWFNQNIFKKSWLFTDIYKPTTYTRSLLLVLLH